VLASVVQGDAVNCNTRQLLYLLFYVANVSQLNPLRPAEAMIMAFEVIIRHSKRTDCAGESVKTSSDAENSNACCTYSRCYCDLFLKKNPFFT